MLWPSFEFYFQNLLEKSNTNLRHLLSHDHRRRFMIYSEELEYAKEKGCRIKLLFRAERIGDKIVGIVAPHFVPRSHPNNGLFDEFNALVVKGLFADEQLSYGKRAGSYPTAA